MILTGDCRDILPTLPDASIDCCVTSPPYALGLRNYGNIPNQIGQEATLDEYIEQLRDVFREVRRVLKPAGTLWLNLGDKYNDKSLMLVPAQVAICLKNDGWILRNEIIWAKTNPMPESVKDRLTCSHEHIFLFTKIETGYYFDAESISESCQESSLKRYNQDIENQSGSSRQPGKTNGPMKAVLPRYGGKKYTENPDIFYRTKSGRAYDPRPRRNKRDVWHFSTARFSGNHFATYPEHLVIPCILAGCPVGGTVLDPFSGSGTTGKVAHDLGREYIGIELNPAYAEASKKRIGAHLQTLLSPRPTK